MGFRPVPNKIEPRQYFKNLKSAFLRYKNIKNLLYTILLIKTLHKGIKGWGSVASTARAMI
jgi:hypothetical protein